MHYPVAPAHLGLGPRFDRDFKEAALQASKLTPSPLKLALYGGAAGVVLGLLFGKPVTYGIVAAGLSGGGALVASTAFSVGVGLATAACGDAIGQLVKPLVSKRPSFEGQQLAPMPMPMPMAGTEHSFW